LGSASPTMPPTHVSSVSRLKIGGRMHSVLDLLTPLVGLMAFLVMPCHLMSYHIMPYHINVDSPVRSRVTWWGVVLLSHVWLRFAFPPHHPPFDLSLVPHPPFLVVGKSGAVFRPCVGFWRDGWVQHIFSVFGPQKNN